MTDILWGTAGAVESQAEETRPAAARGATPTAMREALFERFRHTIRPNLALDRTLVSFQANKQAPFYRWFTYREGFSRPLVHYLLQEVMPHPGILLDPFAGSGAALFAARELGWMTRGIEVLPVGVYAMNARLVAERIDIDAFAQAVQRVLALDFAAYYDDQYAFNHIAITRGAYPAAEERQLIGYISYCHRSITHPDIQMLLLYAAFCILEEISYTRKDGQYLRWDARSGRTQGKKPFDKGRIASFRAAIDQKLHQMVQDLSGAGSQLSLFDDQTTRPCESAPELDIRCGSCLEVLPTMPAASIDGVITSPPYANRYDYTRTYALELVYLGWSDAAVKQLRQTMLSCTVESKDKRAHLEAAYTRLGRHADFTRIEAAFHQQAALQEVLEILDAYRDAGALNNAQIARLVRNYFYEMCFVVYELARLLRPGGCVAMVNDNVQYAGEEVPVDLILSALAETFGLTTRCIWTLGRGKGNSSQQMGNHGRTELRKCVYLWEKQHI